eukprot:scaffold2660_cov257-Pinguiococcus_pyrenoidosus.AAC.12
MSTNVLLDVIRRHALPRSARSSRLRRQSLRTPRHPLRTCWVWPADGAPERGRLLRMRRRRERHDARTHTRRERAVRAALGRAKAAIGANFRKHLHFAAPER